MFLPENNSRRQSFDYNPPFNALKKSSTFNGSGDMHQHQYFVSPNHISSVGNTPRPQQREEGRQNIQNKSMEMAIGEINEKMQKLNRLVEKHESQLSGQGSGSGKADELTETVMNKLRQNVPLFSNSNDVYEHIFNIKMEIKDLKDELTKNNRQNEFKNL